MCSGVVQHAFYCIKRRNPVLRGTEGGQAEDCRSFASKISGYEIIFEDERLTSDTAEENLRAKKIDFRKNKGLVDIESACIILEQYLSRK